MRVHPSVGRVARFGASVAVAVAMIVTAVDGQHAAGPLSVTSDPVAAAVYVDGRFVGHAPIAISALAAGDHRVRLAKDGHSSTAAW